MNDETREWMIKLLELNEIYKTDEYRNNLTVDERDEFVRCQKELGMLIQKMFEQNHQIIL